MYRKILVTLDGSKLAESALPHAVEQARMSGGSVILLRCIDPPQVFMGNVEMSFVEFSDKAARLEREQAEGYLAEIRKRPELASLVVSSIVPCGPAADEILDYAQTEGVELIVLSTHGRTGVGRFLYGSVAERVVRHSPCPVLVVGAGMAVPAPTEVF